MGSASTKDFISTLNDLVETCKDGEQGFRKAAENVKRADLQTLFNEYASERSQFASELQMEVTRLGGDAEKSGSVSGALHRGWMNIKSAVAGADDNAIIAEAERGEDVAKAAYQKAITQDLPAGARRLIDNQADVVRAAHDAVRRLEKSGAR